VSFVRRPEDVLLAKQLIRRAGRHSGDREAGEAGGDRNLDAFLRASDGVMWRGRPRVEMNPERVSGGSEAIIAQPGNRRPVITATQMLESMTENRGPRARKHRMWPTPFSTARTRDASAETASGNIPSRPWA